MSHEGNQPQNHKKTSEMPLATGRDTLALYDAADWLLTTGMKDLVVEKPEEGMITEQLGVAIGGGRWLSINRQRIPSLVDPSKPNEQVPVVTYDEIGHRVYQAPITIQAFDRNVLAQDIEVDAGGNNELGWPADPQVHDYKLPGNLPDKRLNRLDAKNLTALLADIPNMTAGGAILE